MDSTAVMAIVLIGGIIILAFVFKVILFRIYDKVRNERAMRKNAQRPPEMTRLSNRHSTNLNSMDNQRHN